MEPKKRSEASLAIACGLTYPTLRKYRLRGCEGTTPDEILAWRDENIGYGRKSVGERDIPDDGDSGLEDEKLRQQIRKLELENADREMDLAKRRGELLDKDEVMSEALELVHMVRTRLEMIPDQLSADMPDAIRMQQRERTAELIHMILMEMSQTKLATGDLCPPSS